MSYAGLCGYALWYYFSLPEVVPGTDDFLLLSGEDFLLLDFTNFLLLGT